MFLADFADAPHPKTYSLSYFRDLFFGLGAPRHTPEGLPLGGSVREFFLKASGGRLELAGEVSDWVRLPGRIAAVPHWKGGMEPFGESWPIVIAETLRANHIVGANAEGKLRLPDGSLPDGLVFLNTDFGMGGVRREWGDLREVLGKMGRSELWDSAWERLGMPLASFSVTHWPQAPATAKDGTLPQPIPPEGQRFFPLSVMMHEMGHLLADFPDLYGPAYEPWGIFDLMGGPAAWTHFPMSFSAYLRESAGWMRITDLPLRSHPSLLVHPLESHSEAYRLRLGPGAGSESLVLENRAVLEYPPEMAGPPKDLGPRLLAYRVDPAGRRRQGYGDQAVGKLTTVVRRPERFGEVWGEPPYQALSEQSVPSSRNSLGELWWELERITPRADGGLELDALLRARDLATEYTSAQWSAAGDLKPGDLYASEGGACLRSGPTGSPELVLRAPADPLTELRARWEVLAGTPHRLYATISGVSTGAAGGHLAVAVGSRELARLAFTAGDGAPRRLSVDLPQGTRELSLALGGSAGIRVALSDLWLVPLPVCLADFETVSPGSGADPGDGAALGDGRVYYPQVLTVPLGVGRAWEHTWDVSVPQSSGMLRVLAGVASPSTTGAEARMDVRLRLGARSLDLIRNVILAPAAPDGGMAVLETPIPDEARGKEAHITVSLLSVGAQPLTVAVPTLRLTAQ